MVAKHIQDNLLLRHSMVEYYSVYFVRLSEADSFANFLLKDIEKDMSI